MSKSKTSKKEKAARAKSKILRFLKAIEDTYGSMTMIAEKLGRTYGSVYGILRNEKTPQQIKDAYARECERILDVAEETVVDMTIQRLHFPTALQAAKFALTHHPKSVKKGYKEKTEVTLQGGDTPLQIENKNVVSLELLKTLSVKDRKRLLAEMKEKEEEGEEEE